MHNDAFIYLFFHFWFLFFFFRWGGRVVGGGRAGCGVVLAYMCYSCSNIVVFSIHIHAFKKASCVHGSIVSPIMFPPYSNHRQGDSITSAWAALSICVYVCMCVCLYRRIPCVSESLLVMIESCRSPPNFLRETQLCFSARSARLFRHFFRPGVIAGSGLVSSARHGL